MSDPRDVAVVAVAARGLMFYDWVRSETGMEPDGPVRVVAGEKPKAHFSVTRDGKKYKVVVYPI